MRIFTFLICKESKCLSFILSPPIPIDFDK